MWDKSDLNSKLVCQLVCMDSNSVAVSAGLLCLCGLVFYLAMLHYHNLMKVQGDGWLS
jgi:hypothetical protein